MWKLEGCESGDPCSEEKAPRKVLSEVHLGMQGIGVLVSVSTGRAQGFEAWVKLVFGFRESSASTY